MHGSLSAGSSWSNGLGLQPRGEGGKEGEGPCVPLLSQGAQGLCFMLLSVQRQLTAGREDVWLEPGPLNPSWKTCRRPPRKEKVPLPPCSVELFGVIAHTV